MQNLQTSSENAPAVSALAGPGATSYQQPFTVAMTPLGQDELLSVQVAASVQGSLTLQLLRQGRGGGQLLQAWPAIRPLWLRPGPAGFAVVSASEVQFFDPQGCMARLPLGGVSAAEFGADGTLWLLQGQRLYRAPAEAPTEPRPIAAQTAAFALNDTGALLVEIDAAGLVALVQADGQTMQRIATPIVLTELQRQRVALSVSAGVAFLMTQPAFHNGKQGRTLHRFDLGWGQAWPAMALPPLSHAGLRRLPLAAWGTAGVLTLAEPGEALALCLIAREGDTLQPLSPDGLEVLDFSVDVSSDTLAYLALDTAQPGAQRTLTVVRGLTAGAPRSVVYEGVAPAFGQHGGEVALLRQTAAGFEAGVDSAASPRLNVLAHWAEQGQSDQLVWRGAAAGSGWMRGPAPCRGQPLVAVLPGIHKIVTPSLQTNFLQDFMTRVSADLARRGIAACLLQVPGSAGCGKAYRDAAGLDDLAALAAHTRRAIEDLADVTGAPLGLMSASLGTLGTLMALSELAHTDVVTACALLAPVYTPTVVGGSSAHDEQIRTMDTGRCQLLVLHGDRDEVTPYAHSLIFTHGAAAARRRLLTLEGEGHIFAGAAAWQRAAVELDLFFASVLLPKLAQDRTP